MSSWRDLPASVDTEWQEWLGSDALDPDQGQSQIPQWSDSSSKYDTSQRASSGDFTTVGSLAHNHLAVATQTTHAYIADAPQYRAPQAVQQVPLDAGWKVPRQNDGFRIASRNADSGGVPRAPLVGFDYQQRTPGVSRPGARSVWMGHDYGLDGFIPLANMGKVPALRYHGPFHIEPLSLALLAPLPTTTGINPAMHDWTQHELQYSYSSNTSTIAQESGTRGHRFHGGMQVPGTYRETSIAQPSMIAEFGAGWTSVRTTQTISPSRTQASQVPLSTPKHVRAVPSAVASTTGTSPLATAPTARRRTKWHRGSYGRNRDFENYLPSSEPLPTGLSRQEICRNYPNHLHGETLLRVVYGQGNEQGVWKARKIWAECPADGRGNVSKYGRPHNYLEAAIRRAEKDALQDGRARQQQGKRKRRRHEPLSDDDVEEGQIGPPPKHRRTAEGSSGAHVDISSTEVQGVRGQIEGQMNAGASIHTSGWTDSVQNGGVLDVHDIVPNQLPQRRYDPVQNRVASALDQPRAMTLSAPETNATVIGKTRQPAVDAAIAAFKDALRQECSYQHRLIRELNPDIDKLSAEKQQEQVRKIWMTEYGRWEQKVKISYDLELGPPVQDRANISALLEQIFKKEVAENAIEPETEHDALVLKTWTCILSACIQAIKEFREYYAGRFVIEHTQTVAAPGASTPSKTESIVALDGSGGSGPSIPGTTSPRSVQTVEAASQDSNMLLISARDSFESSSVEQPRIVLAVPIPPAESVNIDPSRLRKEDSGPGPKKGSPKAAQEVEDGSRVEGSSVRHLEQVDKDGGLGYVLKFGPTQIAELANNFDYSFEVAGPAEIADPRSNRDVAHFEEALLAQKDHDDESVSTISIEGANEAILGRVQSAKEGSTEKRISSIASKSAERARKISALQAVRSTRNVAAATVAPAPSPAELGAQAGFRAELREAAFPRAEELGASREWIEAQTITGRDEIVYRVEPHDIINWHGAYRGCGQPVTENDAHAAVQWVKNGCPRVHGRFTENSKERRYRENQERREQRKRSQTDQGGD